LHQRISSPPIIVACSAPATTRVTDRLAQLLPVVLTSIDVPMRRSLDEPDAGRAECDPSIVTSGPA
jgi:hypothetical protein